MELFVVILVTVVLLPIILVVEKQRNLVMP